MHILINQVISASIYQPGFRGQHDKFGISFTPDNITSEIRERLSVDLNDVESFRGYLYAASTLRPLVSLINREYAEMQNLFTQADLRNFPRDRFLLNIPVHINVEPFRLQLKGREGIGLSLVGILFDFDQIAEKLQNAE